MTYYAITKSKDRIGNNNYRYRIYSGYESKADLKRKHGRLTNFVAIYTEEQAIERFGTLEQFQPWW